MKVFITGVGGLLGSTLAKYLINKNISVVGVDNFIGGLKENIPEGIEFHELDVLDVEAVKNAMKDCDTVFHAAALPYEGLSVFSPKLCVESIVSGTVSVASAAVSNNIRLFINCSSMARYGNQVPPFVESMTPKPVDPYGLAKYQAEQHLEMLSKIHGLNYVTVVPHNVIGIGQRFNDPYRNVVAIMINRVLQHKPVVIYGDGSQKRSFSNVRDCIEAVFQIMVSSRNLCGQVYNIGPDDNEITIKQLAMKVGHHVGVYPSYDFYPDRPQEVKNAFCSSDKIRKDFNYNCVVSVDQTIKEMVHWIRPIRKDFEYHLPLEIVNEKTPRTWKEKLI